MGGRVATIMGTPGVRHSVGGCGWANEAPHCQGGVEELRQVLGEVSFVGRAESWPCAILLGCGGLPRPQPTLSPAPCPTDRPKERIRRGRGDDKGHGEGRRGPPAVGSHTPDYSTGSGFW